MDLQFWAWISVAVILVLAEAVTGGLFTLPWAIGAGCAALLEALGVSGGWQWLALVGVSSVLVVLAQRFIVRR